MTDDANIAPDNEPVVVRVEEEYHVARARQAAFGVARALGIREPDVYCVATAVSELANNLFFHATGGGRITVAVVKRGRDIGVEVAAEDDGPGIADVEAAMRNGFSTGGGLGGGLPGARRLMDEFEITSEVGVGTRVVARKWRTCR